MEQVEMAPPVSRAQESKAAAEVTLEDEANEGIDFIKEDVQNKVPFALWVFIVAAVLSSLFLFSLDNTIVADIQGPIAHRFGEVGKLPWVGIAFALGNAATMNVWGKLYGIFSAKILYIIGVLIFEAGSAVCGAAPNMNAMIIGRTVAGIGGAGLYLGCLTLIEVTTSLRQRPLYNAFTGITWGLGTVLGPLVGGAFAQNHHTTWRWAFYINLCVGAVFAPVYLIFLPMANPQRGVSLVQKFWQIDWLGFVLNSGYLVCLTMAIAFGGTMFNWNSGSEIALWVVGTFLLLLFIAQQRFAFTTTRDDRIFPCDFLRKPIMWLLFSVMACASTSIFVPVYYIPLYFQFVMRDSPLTAAVRLLPFIFVCVFCGFANGALMGKLGYYMPWYFAGGLFTTIGGAVMSTVDDKSSRAMVYGYSVILGIGSGTFIQASFAVAQAKVPRNRASDATSFIALAQSIGVMLALAISGAIWQNQSFAELQNLLPQITDPDELRSMLSGLEDPSMTLPEKMQMKIEHAKVHAMSHCYFLVVAAGVLTLLASLFMKRERIFMQAGGMI